MDSEAYEKLKRDTAAQVDGWFIQNREHWREKARRTRELCETWNRTWGCYRAEYCLELRQPPVPSFHPILRWTAPEESCNFCVPPGEIPDFEEGEVAEALTCYYAALIVLHDTVGQGYVSIAADIWPESLQNLTAQAFHRECFDKSAFIGAAIRGVEADLAAKEPDDLMPISDIVKATGPDDQKGPWTNPTSMAKWAVILHVSVSTVRRWIQDKTEGRKYHFDQVSKRKWRLPVDEVPSGVWRKVAPSNS